MSSQHVQTGALLSRGFVHDECANGANGLKTNVGGDAGCSKSCDDTAPSPFAPSLLPVESDTQQSNESHVESHDVSSDVVPDVLPWGSSLDPLFWSYVLDQLDCPLHLLQMDSPLLLSIMRVIGISHGTT